MSTVILELPLLIDMDSVLVPYAPVVFMASVAYPREAVFCSCFIISSLTYSKAESDKSIMS